MRLLTKLSLENLHDPNRYERQIDKIFNKMKSLHGLGALFEQKQDSVPLFTFGYDRRNLAKILAASVKKESYFYSPQTQFKIVTKNKERIIYSFSQTDKIVLGVLSNLLNEMFHPFLSPNVYSYRHRITAKNEVADLGHYVAEQRKKRAAKGLYFFQTDIASYSDHVIVSPSSPFWDLIQTFFNELNIRPTDYQWYLIQGAIRPEYYNINGSLQQNIKGLPTGSPITTLLYNFYTTKVDHLFTHLPTLFYARYSDDLILCDPSLDKVRLAEESIHDTMKSLGLSLSEKKTHRMYLSPSGRPGEEPGWKGCSTLELLGHSLNAFGAYTISFKRQKKLLDQTKARISNTLNLLRGETQEHLGRAVCGAVNDYFVDPNIGGNLAKTAVRNSNDVKALAHLDYLIALAVAERISGIRGPQSFRRVPYRKIREDWKLISLTRLRNESF